MCVTVTPPHLRSPCHYLCTATRIALNDATESVVERTLYDKMYFQHELELAMKNGMKKNKVSLADIRRMYEKVSDVSTFEGLLVFGDIIAIRKFSLCQTKGMFRK